MEAAAEVEVEILLAHQALGYPVKGIMEVAAMRVAGVMVVAVVEQVQLEVMAAPQELTEAMAGMDYNII
jgi:hypothetical protein